MNSKLFYLKGNKNQAILKYDDGKYILQKGSKIFEPSEAMKAYNPCLYEDCLKIYNNFTDSENKLVEDMVFRSSSRPGAIANGRSTDGQTDWVDENGLSIKTYLKQINDKNSLFEEFKEYYNEFKEKYENTDSVRFFNDRTEKFRRDYSLEKIKNLLLTEYALGGENFKETLSYKLEYGEYSNVGPSISGATSNKYGVYNSTEGYKNRDGIIVDIENFWKIFKEQLCNYLTELGIMKEPFNPYDKYDKLKGMSMVIIKMVYLYWPTKFAGIASRDKLITILKAFGIDFNKDLPAEQLSFLLNKYIKDNFSEIENDSPEILSILLWQFFKDDDIDIVEERQNFWFVSSYWGDINGEQTERFIREGIWQLGYDNDHSDLVKEMQPGDKIALKATFTKKADIPFNTNGKNVSVMAIKAIGTISANSGDGKTIKVNWEKEFKPWKNWYMFTYRKVIWKVWRHDDDWMYNNLIDFTFYDKPQDYQGFLDHPFWGSRYIEGADNESNNKQFTKEDFLARVYLNETEYDKLKSLLIRKKNIILQGAPGVGKTYMAKKLAYSIMGEENDARILCIQFHQSYSYEDFVEGYRPNLDGNGTFKIEDGIFKRFCKDAIEDSENNYYIIIDEINRGNISKILGELLMLIESDKRGEKILLPYSKEEFYVPENLYIIGMMNTADRSLAVIDYALRRRFSFYTVNPAFKNNKFIDYINKYSDSKLNRIINKIEELNIRISGDPALGEGFQIGHSYFCNLKTGSREEIEAIIQFEIIPLLKEYWFDDEKCYNDWHNLLNGIINE